MPIRLFAPRYWPTWLGLGLLRTFAVLPFGWLIPEWGTGARCPDAAPCSLPFTRTARRNIELWPAAVERRGSAKNCSRGTSQGLGIQPSSRPGLHLVGIPGAFQADRQSRKAARISRAALASRPGCHPAHRSLHHGSRSARAHPGGRSNQPAFCIGRPGNEGAPPGSLARLAVAGSAATRFPADRYSAPLIKGSQTQRMRLVMRRTRAYRKKGAQMVELFGISCPRPTTFTSRLARMTGANGGCPYFLLRAPAPVRQGYRAVITSGVRQLSEASVPVADNRTLQPSDRGAGFRKVPEQYL